MDTNDYTGTPKSEMVHSTEDAARIAQLQCDVDYWRGHAKTVEALAVSLEARLARLEEENNRLRSEAGYHEAKDVIALLTTERDALLARLARLDGEDYAMEGRDA